MGRCSYFGGAFARFLPEKVSYMKVFFVVLSMFLLSLSASAQPPELTPEQRATLDNYQDTIGMLSFLVLRDTSAEMRFVATKKLIKTLVQALRTENSFAYKFPLVKNISIQYPADSSFRIFTWQLFVDDEHYQYFGAIQRNTSQLELFPLVDRSEQFTDLQATTAPTDWYGALYYNIHQFDTPTGRRYLLFGFDGYRFFDKRKVIEVMDFDDMGQPRFGHYPTFQQVDPKTLEPTDTLRRVVLEYSAESSVGSNFNPVEQAIVHDFLVEMGNPYNKQLSSYPDGTFIGYFAGPDGVWTQKPRMFTTTVDEAPRDQPVLGTEGSREKRDIFGRRIKDD